MEERCGGDRAGLLYSWCFSDIKKKGAARRQLQEGEAVGHLDSVGGGAHWNGVERRQGEEEAETDGRQGN